MIVLINMVKILMMSEKMATWDLLKIKAFWNKGYGVITFVYDVSNNILSRESNYIVDMIMWPKLGNYDISMREVMATFLRGGLGSSSII